MVVPKDLLRVLACPKCKGDVSEKGMFIICRKCGIAYPVLDKTVPDMLIEDSWPLSEASGSGFRHTLKL